MKFVARLVIFLALFSVPARLGAGTLGAGTIFSRYSHREWRKSRRCRLLRLFHLRPWKPQR